MDNLNVIKEINAAVSGMHSTLFQLSALWMKYRPQGDIFWCPTPEAIDEPIAEIYHQVQSLFESYKNNSYLIKKVHNFLLELDSYLVKDGQKSDDWYYEVKVFLEDEESVSTDDYKILKSNVMPKLKDLKDAMHLLLEEKSIALPNYEDEDQPFNKGEKIKFEPVKLGDRASINQIVSVFYDLHENGYLDTSKVNLIKMMRSVFRNSDQSPLSESTLHTYMKADRPETRPKSIKFNKLKINTITYIPIPNRIPGDIFFNTLAPSLLHGSNNNPERK